MSQTNSGIFIHAYMYINMYVCIQKCIYLNIWNIQTYDFTSMFVLIIPLSGWGNWYVGIYLYIYALGGHFYPKLLTQGPSFFILHSLHFICLYMPIHSISVWDTSPIISEAGRVCYGSLLWLYRCPTAKQLSQQLLGPGRWWWHIITQADVRRTGYAARASSPTCRGPLF